MNIIPKINGPVSLASGACTLTAGSPAVQVSRDPALPKEGYTLTIQPDSLLLCAADDAGEFYGMQTVAQLREEGEAPCGVYQDAPRYAFRSYMLDVSRHFFSVQEVKRLLDQMARLKLNTFHWHLSDDQGFRIESKKFPQLNETGSWRMEGDQKVGGYYTQEEIREIVAYAQERFITVIPEIDLPGHTLSIVATFPELSCSGEPIAVAHGSGIFPRILCAGSDKVYQFLYDLLEEVCGLFPGPYFHIGGDEAPKSEWEKCPRCQQRIQEEGLQNEEELQAWFTGKLVDFLESKGKTVIGWNEILASGTVSPKAIAQYWVEEGAEAAAKEAEKGRRFVFSPVASFYLDYPAALVPLEAVYGTEPCILKDKPIPKAQVLGLEAPLWTERVATDDHVERLTFPRLLALAENCWTEEKDFSDFKARAQAYTAWLEKCGIACTPVEQCDLHGSDRAKLAGAQIADVLYGFTTSITDPEERGKTMRQRCGQFIRGFMKGKCSEEELQLAEEAGLERVKELGF